jgi:hypothetical protein
MRTQSDPARPLFDFRFVDVADVGDHADAIAAMYAKHLDGMIVRGVLPPAAVDAAVRSLDADTLPKWQFPDYADRAEPAYTIGRPIVGADPTLEAYFDDAVFQRARLRTLFDGHLDFEQRLYGVVSALAGGLPVDVAPGPGSKTCPPATVRVLPENTEIGIHVGNEFIRMPQAEHLRSIVDMSDQISYFLPLSTPERGGELIVYGVEWQDCRSFLPASGPGRSNVWNEVTAVFEAFKDFGSTAFSPEPGDLLIFDGGRYFHRVAKTEGRRPRRTIGGFIGFSKGRERVYVWS